jgi:hypothetical protein
MMTAALLLVLATAGDREVVEPSQWLTVQVSAGGGARAIAVSEGIFSGNADLRLGARFEPVHFGLTVHGLFSNASGVGFGGFLLFDAVRVQVDSVLSVAFVAGVEGLARLLPSRATPWSAVLLADVGFRVFGFSLTIAGGAELQLPSVGGEAQVRFGVDFVEVVGLCQRLRAQDEPSFPGQ